MHPTLDLNFFELPLYTALIALGALLGLASAFLFLHHRSHKRFALNLFLDGALVVFAAGWIGARVYHVALHWDYYNARPDEIAQAGIGGLAIRGAFIAGFIALAIFARIRDVSFLRLADASAIGFAIGQAIGWIGAFAQGANYGIVSDSFIAMELPDVYGLIEPRVPLQLFEIALFFLLFIGLALLAIRQPRRGTIFLYYLIAASFANFALGFLRGDESLYIGALRVDQMVDAIFATIALVGLLWQSARREHSIPEFSGIQL